MLFPESDLESESTAPNDTSEERPEQEAVNASRSSYSGVSSSFRSLNSTLPLADTPASEQSKRGRGRPPKIPQVTSSLSPDPSPIVAPSALKTGSSAAKPAIRTPEIQHFQYDSTEGSIMLSSAKAPQSARRVSFSSEFSDRGGFDEQQVDDIRFDDEASPESVRPASVAVSTKKESARK